jgi:hypothetical protein
MTQENSDEHAATTAIELARETPLPVVAPQGKSTDQQRTDAVGQMLAAAYSKASTLTLTMEESKALMAPFPDEAVYMGAGGDERLLYITHSYIEDRLHEVLGVGQWSLIPRQTRMEQDGKKTTVFVDAVLLIRGCFVGEDWGAMDYYPANGKMNYDDAYSGAQSNALRRIAGKRLGVGSQVWKKDYCNAWKERHAQPQRTPMAKQKQAEQPAEVATQREARGLIATVQTGESKGVQRWGATIEGVIYGTSDAALGRAMQDACDSKLNVALTWEHRGGKKEAVKIEENEVTV